MKTSTLLQKMAYIACISLPAWAMAENPVDTKKVIRLTTLSAQDWQTACYQGSSINNGCYGEVGSDASLKINQFTHFSSSGNVDFGTRGVSDSLFLKVIPKGTILTNLIWQTPSTGNYSECSAFTANGAPYLGILGSNRNVVGTNNVPIRIYVKNNAGTTLTIPMFAPSASGTLTQDLYVICVGTTSAGVPSTILGGNLTYS